jgi:hypothetical protein
MSNPFAETIQVRPARLIAVKKGGINGNLLGETERDRKEVVVD